MAVLRDLQRMVRDRQRVEFQRRPAEVKERVRVRRRLRLARRVRAVRQEERLPLREERRAVALRVRDARRRMLVTRLLEKREQQEERRDRVKDRMPHRQRWR